MSKHCIWLGRDCEILPDTEKEIYEQGKVDERERIKDIIISNLENAFLMEKLLREISRD